MVLGVLANHCFPLVLLLQSSREQARKHAKVPGSRRSLRSELLQRLAYPHATDEAVPLQSREALLHVVWALIQDYLGEPPKMQVVTYEVDPFTCNHTVKVWDPRSGRAATRFLTGHTDTVLTVAMKGNIVLTGSYDCTARAWDASRGVLLKTILFDCSVTAVGIEQSTIILGGSNGMAVLGKITGEQPVLPYGLQAVEKADCVRLVGHCKGISSVLLHGCMAVTGSSDCTARIWNTATGRVKHVLSGHKRRVASVSMHRNLQLLATGSMDGTARLWNSESGMLLDIISFATLPASGLFSCFLTSDPVVSLAIAGDFVAMGSGRGAVQVWNRRTKELQVLAKGEYGLLGSSAAVAVQSHGLVVAGFKAGLAKAWNVKEGTSPFLLTSGFHAHVANPSYALML
ncbi:Btrc [Symbiodinium microadriaticum]|nr:Btrc [Symbiodinium sp. KB8]CAE7843448.1 Btrc [Symbiodinium microadriaticum]